MKNITSGWYYFVRNDRLYEDVIVAAPHPWVDIVYVYPDGDFEDSLLRGSTDSIRNISEWGPDAVGKNFFKIEIPDHIRAQYPDLEM